MGTAATIGHQLCGDSGLFKFNLRNACVRNFWSAFLPAAVAFIFCLSLLPIPRSVRGLISSSQAPFKRFLTLEEAETLDASSGVQDGSDGSQNVYVKAVNCVWNWRTIVFSCIGLMQTLTWLSTGAFCLIVTPQDVWSYIVPILTAFSWLYTAVRPIVHTPKTPPYDLLAIYLAHCIGATLRLGGIVYECSVYRAPFPSGVAIAAYIVNYLVIAGLIMVISDMPLALSTRYAKEEHICDSVSPEDCTTLWGWVSVSWIDPLIKKGRMSTMTENDVWPLTLTMRSRPIFIKFNHTRHLSLVRRIWNSNSHDLIIEFILKIFCVALSYADPFFLKRILDAIDSEDFENRSQAYVYACLAFLCTLMQAFAEAQRAWIGRRAAARTRSELTAAIYDKALKRKDFSGVVSDEIATNGRISGDHSIPGKGKARARSDKTNNPKPSADVGKIINLMSNDVNKLMQTVGTLYWTYGPVFDIIFAFTLLYQLLGFSAFAGLLVIAAASPLESYLTKRGIYIQKGLVSAQDRRMSVLSELLSAIKFIKFFAWEDRWIARALDARQIELAWMIKARFNSVLFSLVASSAPVLISTVSFFVYVIQGNELTVSTAFTSIALFSMVRLPLVSLPTSIVQLFQTGVVVERVAAYLAEDEVSDQVSSLNKSNVIPLVATSSGAGLGFERASFTWNELENLANNDDAKKRSTNTSTTTLVAETSNYDEHLVVDGASTSGSLKSRFELKDISVLFPDGKLTVITGPTASGKTALLMALLGEMTLLSGRLIMSKDMTNRDENGMSYSISYAAQTPWLQHMSIRDNILFGSPYDDVRYNAVLDSCALMPDLEILEDGDATEIGAGGLNLSGGQKARVALARAAYARTKYVLLDDPLSAVDSHTARWLYEKLLRGPLLAHRTVVLVTHHVELVLPGTHHLIRMLGGRIDTQGPVEVLRAQGTLDRITQEEAVAASEEAADIDDPVPVDVVGLNALPVKKPKKLVEDEKRAVGGVKWAIYKTYLQASSYYIWFFLGFAIISTQIVGVAEKLWIKAWGEAYKNDSVSNSRSIFSENFPSAQEHPLFYVGIYASIGLSTAILSDVSAIAQYVGAMKASRALFKQLLVRVVRGTMRWHDITPQGRVLNRFSKDMDTIDSSVASSLRSVSSSIAAISVAILTVAIIFPWFLIPATVISLAYRELVVGYVNTGRDLRRMESTSRSPIVSGFSELLTGITTVRAFSAETRFLDGLHRRVDDMTRMWHAFWMTNRWLMLRFDVLGGATVFITTIFALSGFVSAGIAGLCITSAMKFNANLYWMCRNWTTLELDLNSVERFVEYLNVPQEPPSVIPTRRPPAYWPSSTNNDALIVVEDLDVKYAPELPPVLHGVSFALKAHERIGILGRTGSGKSTLAMSLLRFVDPSRGRILIDGIDIATIGTDDLRSRLTFIPQDVTLFSGTLRENLDPFNEHTDAACLDVLIRVHLIGEDAELSRSSSKSVLHGEGSSLGSPSAITAATNAGTSVSLTLDTLISAGGMNVSQGQRQLIALARALLRSSPIVILDEATSSIDFETDMAVQDALRTEFRSALLLTVAHRLRTVIDYDRLLVLDKGVVVEFDTPLALITKADGVFRNMCVQSGAFDDLEAAVRAAAGEA